MSRLRLGGRSTTGTLVIALLTAITSAAPAAAAPCPDERLEQPYVLYLDFGHYFIAPGGHFEGDTTKWKTRGGAGLQPNGRLNDYGGAQVMRLPWGSSATSPPVCVDAGRPYLRFDVKASWLLTRLRVDAIRDDGEVVPLGSVTSLLDALVWGVSPRIPLAGPLGLRGDASESVRIRIAAVTGDWAIDDVAIDPYKKG